MTVFLTPPGESRPTQQLGLDINGKLVTAELGPQPGEMVPGRVDYATWVLQHQAYSAAEWHPSGQVSGEEFRPFWQKQADQALAAIARALTAGLQGKPAATAVSVPQILECVDKRNCNNMTRASLWWFDIAAIPVLTFVDNGWTYALMSNSWAGHGPLRIFLTVPGEKFASQTLTLDLTGQLVSAELGPQPGDARQAGATREERAASQATWRQRHKSYSRTEGADFKEFWQKQSDQAMAAIQRQLSK